MAARKSRPGRSLTYEERKAAGRATRSLTLSDQTVTWLDDLGTEYELNRSEVVEKLVREAISRLLQKKK